jgi:hypothetical protein
MKEVHELIEQLQARLKNAGGGEIIITDKNFNIKLTTDRFPKGNTTSFVSKTRNI